MVLTQEQASYVCQFFAWVKQAKPGSYKIKDELTISILKELIEGQYYNKIEISSDYKFFKVAHPMWGWINPKDIKIEIKSVTQDDLKLGNSDARLNTVPPQKEQEQVEPVKKVIVKQTSLF